MNRMFQDGFEMGSLDQLRGWNCDLERAKARFVENRRWNLGPAEEGDFLKGYIAGYLDQDLEELPDLDVVKEGRNFK